MISENLSHCTGCGACKQACPVNCIQLSENLDGFKYPIIDHSRCIKCQKCDRVCPIDKDFISTSKPKAYACVSKDKKQLMRETSGGVFGAIANYVLDNKGVVYGCAFDRKLIAKHIRVDRVEDLHLLFGSKYVQSDTGQSFFEAQKDLLNGRLVLFSGTPCQIAGLVSFLGKEYENLITLDIICHGVPSQLSFTKYIKWLSKKQNGKIVEYSFRDKKVNGWSYSGYYTVKTDKKIFQKTFHYFDHYYYYYFLKGIISRDSCYTCNYSNMNRTSDFTIGDWWGAEGLNLSFNIENGCSVVLVNSMKAAEIFNHLSLKYKEVSIIDTLKYHEHLKSPSNRPQLRRSIMDDLMNKSADEIQNDFLRGNYKSIIIGRIKYIVPKKVKTILQRLRYNNKRRLF